MRLADLLPSVTAPPSNAPDAAPDPRASDPAGPTAVHPDAAPDPRTSEPAGPTAAHPDAALDPDALYEA
ncbi:MAG TPA: hypothetical protein PLF56_05750, partial [Micropruina sp.]|nr:hypothetical protein [Micropruina sp.]